MYSEAYGYMMMMYHDDRGLPYSIEPLGPGAAWPHGQPRLVIIQSNPLLSPTSQMRLLVYLACVSV
jgi:hypothetical protein